MHAPSGSSEEDAARLLAALLAIVRQVKARASADRDHGTAVMLLPHLAGEQALRLSDLACCVGLDHSTVSRHVRQLEDAGLVHRVDDPSDRRASLLVITARGRQALDEAVRLRAAALAEALAGWPESDRRALGDLAARLAAALEHAAASAVRPD